MKIEANGLSKYYGGFRALDRASFEIHPGQIVALLGANGAGKTTLLRCLSGLAAPDKGFILLNDETFTRDRLDLRRRIAFLPDFPFAFWDMTVLRHIGLTVNIYEAQYPGIEERTLRLLRDFDLMPLAESPLQNLSRGQIYKACLAALLVVNPEIWLLDEPFASGMDPHGISVFKEYAREAAGQGRTIIYSTQILDVVERFSDRVCILQQGEIRAFDSVERLRGGAEGASGGLEEIFRQFREEDRK